MSVAYGVTGPSHPVLGKVAYRPGLPAVRGLFAGRGFHRPYGRLARERGRSMRERLASGDTAYLLGISTGSHNAGAALVEASSRGGVRLLCNNEEERKLLIAHHEIFSPSALLLPSCSLALAVVDCWAACLWWDHATLLTVCEDEGSSRSFRDRTRSP